LRSFKSLGWVYLPEMALHEDIASYGVTVTDSIHRSGLPHHHQEGTKRFKSGWKGKQNDAGKEGVAIKWT
jgi:hypothetical protein